MPNDERRRRGADPDLFNFMPPLCSNLFLCWCGGELNVGSMWSEEIEAEERGSTPLLLLSLWTLSILDPKSLTFLPCHPESQPKLVGEMALEEPRLIWKNWRWR